MDTIDNFDSTTTSRAHTPVSPLTPLPDTPDPSTKAADSPNSSQLAPQPTVGAGRAASGSAHLADPSSTPETLSNITLNPIARRRQQLLDDPLSIYLGGPHSALPMVGWVRHNRTNICVRAEAATEYERLCEEYHKHPGDSTPPSVPDPAVFTAIVRLADDKFFLQSDANYTGRGPFTMSFADVKMTALADAPSSVDKDFSTVLANLDAIVRAHKTRGYQAVKGLFDIGSGHRTIRIRHVLFTPRADVESDTENRSSMRYVFSYVSAYCLCSTPVVPPEFTIAEWPVNPKHTAAVQDIATMLDTHVVNYLPAFDIHGHLISPSDYEKQLRGAVVALRFTLTHWAIRGRSQVPPSDSFVADIEDISVVEEPSDLVVVGPKKRRRTFAMNDPYYPSKKQHRLLD
ncbi:hypothetical protein EIP86_000969 [Pleurotus ostreatoroseus]|nr:hypothetical protein EIP86_000969 [Pleurotus ostreatoroseus]